MTNSMRVLNVNPILDVWCALCDHLAPFAAMAVVPLLLWVHHFETMPPAAIHESGSTEPVTAACSSVT